MRIGHCLSFTQEPCLEQLGKVTSYYDQLTDLDSGP